MKARYKYQLSKEQLETAKQVAHETFRQDGLEYVRRIEKIFCLALNERFGFGKERLSKFIDEVREISDKHVDDEVFWVHADQKLQQIGLDFPPEDYEKMEG